MTSVFSWQTLLAFAPCHFVLQGQICLLLQVFLDFLPFAFQSPIMKRTSFFCVCWFQKVLQVFIEPFNVSFFSITGWGIDLDYCDIEWFALEMNIDYSVILDNASKYCISDSFVDYDYKVEVANRFNVLDLIECLENYGWRFVTLYRMW